MNHGNGGGGGAGRDPTRRNRKQGTKAKGWRKQSTFDVPSRWTSWKLPHELLGEHVVVRDHLLPIVVEEVRGEHVHACTPEDVAFVLSKLPRECLFGIEDLAGIVLRQPTEKQEQLTPVWGRLCYHATVSPLSGPVIFLEAHVPFARWCCGRRQSLEGQGELRRMLHLAPYERLTREGHEFAWGRLNLRRWQLYHTLLHEVGHWTDYLCKVVLPSRQPGGRSYDDLLDDYFARPSSEREAFAHRFSDDWRDQLVRTGVLPLPRRYDPGAWRRQQINPAWFGAPDPAEDAAGPEIKPFLAFHREPLRPKLP